MDDTVARELFEQSNSLYAEKRYGEALELLERLDEAFPNTKNILYPKAICLAKLNRIEEAESLYHFLARHFPEKRAQKLWNMIHAHRTAPTAVTRDGNLPPLEIPNDISLDPPAPQAPAQPQDEGPNYWLYAGIGALALLLVGLFSIPLLVESTLPPPAEVQPLFDEPIVLTEENIRNLTQEQQAHFGSVVIFVLLPIMAILAPIPLYATLVLFGEPPFESFWADYLHAFGWTLLFGLMSAFCPLIGFILGLYILHRVYDLGLGNILIYVGFLIVFSFAWGLIAPIILGGFGYALP